MRAPAGPITAPKKKPYIGPTVAPPNKAPLIGGNYSTGAVNRAVDRISTPKPAPVVVANNQGNYTRPKPPPAVRPGPVTPVANKNQAPVALNRGAVGNKAPGPSANPPTAGASPTQPLPPGIDEYLAGDTTYQAATSGYNKTLSDYLADATGQRTTGAASFADRFRQLQQSRDQDVAGLQEDYAGRGLLQSGVYADALSNMQSQYDTSNANLTAEQTQFGTGLDTGITNEQALIAQQIQAAKDAAIQRRLTQYGL